MEPKPPGRFSATLGADEARTTAGDGTAQVGWEPQPIIAAALVWRMKSEGGQRGSTLRKKDAPGIPGAVEVKNSCRESRKSNLSALWRKYGYEFVTVRREEEGSPQTRRTQRRLGEILCDLCVLCERKSFRIFGVFPRWAGRIRHCNCATEHLVVQGDLMTSPIHHTRTGSAKMQALVVGSGMSAMMAARSLLDLGESVLLVQAGSPESWLYTWTPGLNLQEEAALLSDNLEEAEIVGLTEYPKISREGVGFEVDLGAVGKRRCGCVVLAPGTMTAQLPPGLPDGTGMIVPKREWLYGQAVAFVLDYGAPSDPAVGMAAIRHALDISVEDGIAYVLMRHVPVAGPGGELLYDEAKRAGVQFYRFGDTLPEIVTVDNGKGEANGKAMEMSGRILVKLIDLIDPDRMVELECDSVLAAPELRPDPGLSGLFEIAGGPDSDGFLLPESAHCHSGKTFRGGVFAIGEATGEFDLLRVRAQAAAVASSARAWMLSAGEREQAMAVTVEESCIRCLTCARVCPHAAVSFDPGPARSQVRFSSAACRECGICVSECPRGVLDLRLSPNTAFRAVFDALSLSWGNSPVVVYGCGRSAGRSAKKIKLPSEVWFFSVPCAGRVSESMVLNTLSAGARGVLVLGCHDGNCASSTGTNWSKARVETAIGGMPGVPLPVGYGTVASNEPARLLRMVNDFIDGLEAGPRHQAPALQRT